MSEAELWAEIMAEEPGGQNHGRRRGPDGGWQSLAHDQMDAIQAQYEYIVYGPVHGTSSSYNDGCRCEACTRWNRERVRKQRRNASVRPQEARRDEDSPNTWSDMG